MRGSTKSLHVVRFGSFEVDLRAGELRKGGVRVHLEGQPFQVLATLLERPGEVVTRDELRETLWSSDTFVDFDHGLNTAISKIREALGDSASHPRFVETLPRRGYRFVYPMEGAAAIQATAEKPNSKSLAAVAPTPQGAHRKTAFWFITTLLLLAAGSLAVWSFRNPGTTRREPPTVVPLTSLPGVEVHPTFSPDGSQIAFAWRREQATGSAADFDIYVKVVGSATQPVRLTDNSAPEWSPTWSPDGRHIAFLRGRGEWESDVILISPLGGRERKIGEAVSPRGLGFMDSLQSNLAWTPDSKWLIHPWRSGEGAPSLFLLSIATGERRALTEGAAFGDGEPAVSPDGRTLAFARYTDTVVCNLYVQELTAGLGLSGNLRQLTFDGRSVGRPAWTPGRDELVVGVSSWFPGHSAGLSRVDPSNPGSLLPLEYAGRNAWHPAISYQGNRLAYTQPIVDQDIWTLDLTAANAEPVRLIDSTRTDHRADFSPDGERIVFGSNRAGSLEIWICDRDGSNPLRLTSLGDYLTGSAQWSPDGRTIAFDSTFRGNHDVYTVSPEGGPVRPLTSHPAMDNSPTWSADGAWIYFQSNRTGRPEIWRVAAEGVEPVQVTAGGGIQAFESRDGRHLYFYKSRDPSTMSRLTLATGEQETLFVSSGTAYFALTDEGIYFLGGDGGDDLRFYSFATRRATTIRKFDENLCCGFDVSPDGRTLLFTTFRLGADLMLVENFR